MGNTGRQNSDGTTGSKQGTRPGIDSKQDPIDIERALQLLTVERRRHLLLVVQHHDGRLSLDAVARAICRRESEQSVTDPAASDRLKAELHHVHLPKLDDAGLLTYDADQLTVSVTVDSEPVQQLLDAVRFTVRVYPEDATAGTA